MGIRRARSSHSLFDAPATAREQRALAGKLADARDEARRRHLPPAASETRLVIPSRRSRLKKRRAVGGQCVANGRAEAAVERLARRGVIPARATVQNAPVGQGHLVKANPSSQLAGGNPTNLSPDVEVVSLIFLFHAP